MTQHWIQNAIFYHIYPLGLLGAPEKNNFYGQVINRLSSLEPWLDHIQSLGANAIYLGPVLQSTSHGYDTVDYMQVDRRLGDNRDLACFAKNVHARGMRLVLDAVFNHVGRDFWAFKDLLANGKNSKYRGWFHNLRFDERSSKGDPFNYEGWHGHASLVKLNLANPEVRAHLFEAVRLWVEDFEIDGLRLDAADCIDLDFLQALRRFTDGLREDFWLMGEVVHGDYRHWVNSTTLHSVTNYECYKGLYSSLLEGNYFEIDYALNRQFGVEGLYRGMALYNFVDNHDVDRVASKLKPPILLYPLYLLLFTMPGVPSIYYGSEWGIKGEKGPWSDIALRPSLDLGQILITPPEPDLPKAIDRLVEIRKGSKALRSGAYRTVDVSHRQLVFLREYTDERVMVLLNSAPDSVDLEFNLNFPVHSARDLLDPGYTQEFDKVRIRVSIPPTWGRILVLS